MSGGMYRQTLLVFGRQTEKSFGPRLNAYMQDISGNMNDPTTQEPRTQSGLVLPRCPAR